MKTLINKANSAIRITAPEIIICEPYYSIDCSYKYNTELLFLNKENWTLVEEEPAHWKPNEEQMKALSDTIAFAPDTFKPKCTLVTLQDDLKKLIEE